MPMRSYFDLVDEFPRSYLIVGVVGPMPATLPPYAGPAVLLERLIEAQRPKGAWAVAPIQDGSLFALHCVFQLEGDADRLARAVLAQGIGCYPGFNSQREFRFDRAMQKAVRDALKELE